MAQILVQTKKKCPILPWMIEFHSSADGQILNNQLKSAFASNYLDHLSNLHEKSKKGRKRLTQLLVAIPPNCKDHQIEDFLKAGMTVALLPLNLSTLEDIPTLVRLIQKVVENFSKMIGRLYPLAIAVDILEPTVATGKVKRPVQLEKGKITKIVSDSQFLNQTGKDYIYIDNSSLVKALKPGDSIILGDGNIQMSALNVVRDIVECIVEKAGLLSDNLTVNVPNAPLVPLECFNLKNLVKIFEKCSIDMIFATSSNIEQARELLGPQNFYILKVENVESVEAISTLSKTVDGVLIDGEKLMITSKENVFLLQKSIIGSCIKMGKPVISSIRCHSITKAQIGDIANTVIDGTDGLLVPPDGTLMESISLVCKSAEGAVYQKQLFDNLLQLRPPPIEPIEAIAIAAVEASFQCNAAAIILLTTSGRSAKLISKYRPKCPIISLTRVGRTAKQLMIYKGIISVFYHSLEQSIEQTIQYGMTFGKINGYIKMGDAVVIVFGKKNQIGFRNCVEVVFASEYNTVLEDK